MKKYLLSGFLITAMLFTCNTSASAQGFLGKIKKAASSVISGTSEKETESTETEESDTTEIKTPKWDNIPNYTLVMIKLNDRNGNPILNEDGSQKVKVLFRSDKDSTDFRSSEVVHQQCRDLDKIVTRIVAKVGGGTLLGTIGGMAVSGKKDKGKGALLGAAVGAGAGLALSAGDLKKAKAVKKQMKELQALLEVYQKNFTREGNPINASADLSNIDGIDFSKNQTAMVSEDVDAICRRESFNDPNADWM